MVKITNTSCSGQLTLPRNVPRVHSKENKFFYNARVLGKCCGNSCKAHIKLAMSELGVRCVDETYLKFYILAL